MSRSVRFIAPAIVLIALVWPNASASAANPTNLGRQLVNRYLSEVQRHDVAGLRAFLSPAFQIQRADGTRVTKGEFLGNPARISGYQIRGLRVTRDSNVLIVTFENKTTSEVIHGQLFGSGWTPRLATFVHIARGWQITSFANFNLPQAPAAIH